MQVPSGSALSSGGVAWVHTPGALQAPQLSGGSPCSSESSQQKAKRPAGRAQTRRRSPGSHLCGCFPAASSAALQQFSRSPGCLKQGFHVPLCSVPLPPFQAAKDTLMAMTALLRLIGGAVVGSTKTGTLNRFRSRSWTQKEFAKIKSPDSVLTQRLAYLIHLTLAPALGGRYMPPLCRRQV